MKVDNQIDEETGEFIGQILDEMTNLIGEIRESVKGQKVIRFASQVHTLHWHVDGLMEGAKQIMAPKPELPEGMTLPDGVTAIPIPPELAARLAPGLAKMGQNGDVHANGDGGPGGQYL